MKDSYGIHGNRQKAKINHYRRKEIS